MEYIIDITKPPIGPPCRSIKGSLFGDYETKKSKEQTKKWNLYIDKYLIVLKNSRKGNKK